MIFAKTFRGVSGNRPAIRRERKLTHAHLDLLLLRLILGNAHACRLGRGVNDARNNPVIHVTRPCLRYIPTRPRLPHAPCAPAMGTLDHVADRVDTWHARLPMAVDRNPSPLGQLHTRLVEIESGRERLASPPRPGRCRLRTKTFLSPWTPCSSTLLSLTLADSIFVLSSNFIPSFSRFRCKNLRCLRIENRSPRSAAKNSMTVTSAPSRAQTEPSSSPIAPAPMTSILFGTLSSAMPWSLLITRFAVEFQEGQFHRHAARRQQNILRLQRFSSSRRRPSPRRYFRQPACRDPSRLRSCSSSSGRQTPPVSLLTTSPLRFIMASRSTLISPAIMPWIAKPLLCENGDIRSKRANALLGMQPTLRTCPRRAFLSFSTMAVLRPSLRSANGRDVTTGDRYQ